MVQILLKIKKILPNGGRVMDLTKRLGWIALALSFFAGNASAVLIGDKDWINPQDTVFDRVDHLGIPGQGFRWTEIALGNQPEASGEIDDEGGVCPIGGGLCSGVISGFDFTGLVWASVDEVVELLQGFYPALSTAAATAGTGQFIQEDDSAFAPLFVGLFSAQPTGTTETTVAGWTASLSDAPSGCDLALAAGVVDNFLDGPSDGIGTLPDCRVRESGVWLYRQVATNEIPEPTTLALAGLGIAGLGFRRRKT